MIAFTTPLALSKCSRTFHPYISPLLSPRAPIPSFQTPTTATLHSTHSILVAQAAGSPSKQRMPAVLRPVVPGPELFQFNIEDKAQSRSEIVRHISAYVRQHNLQDPNNRRVIKCDKKLRDILGVESCTYIEINGHISRYVRKPEDLGGRYVDEAEQVERIYLEQKAAQPTVKKPLRSKKPAKPKNFKQVTLSKDLAVVCRAPEMTRPEILKAVWAYIRLNNLQGTPGEPVKCDFLLKKVFNADQVDARGIMKGISPHILKKD